jgi:hypothetical protein
MKTGEKMKTGEDRDRAETRKKKTSGVETVFNGRCPSCGWEDRVSLYFLYRHE